MQEILDMFRKAQDCIASAEYNLKGDFLDAAVNRSYYGIFDALSALLQSKSLYPKSHSGALSLFSEHFIKSGILPKEVGGWVHFCFEMRQQCDYDFNSKVDFDTANQCLHYSKEFLSLTRNYLEGTFEISLN